MARDRGLVRLGDRCSPGERVDDDLTWPAGVCVATDDCVPGDEKTTCPADSTCVRVSEGMNCAPAGPRGLGELCLAELADGTANCAEGLVCAYDRCRTPCGVCAGGEDCVSWAGWLHDDAPEVSMCASRRATRSARQGAAPASAAGWSTRTRTSPWRPADREASPTRPQARSARKTGTASPRAPPTTTSAANGAPARRGSASHSARPTTRGTARCWKSACPTSIAGVRRSGSAAVTASASTRGDARTERFVGPETCTSTRRATKCSSGCADPTMATAWASTVAWRSTGTAPRGS